jgi:hypothetical protein
MAFASPFFIEVNSLLLILPEPSMAMHRRTLAQVGVAEAWLPPQIGTIASATRPSANCLILVDVSAAMFLSNLALAASHWGAFEDRSLVRMIPLV